MAAELHWQLKNNMVGLCFPMANNTKCNQIVQRIGRLPIKKFFKWADMVNVQSNTSCFPMTRAATITISLQRKTPLFRPIWAIIREITTLKCWMILWNKAYKIIPTFEGTKAATSFTSCITTSTMANIYQGITIFTGFHLWRSHSFRDFLPHLSFAKVFSVFDGFLLMPSLILFGSHIAAKIRTIFFRNLTWIGIKLFSANKTILEYARFSSSIPRHITFDERSPDKSLRCCHALIIAQGVS